MTDEPTKNAAGFPFATAIATLCALFLFAVIVLTLYRSPNLLGEPKREPAADPIEKLDEVRNRNQSILDGRDATVRMSVNQSAAAIVKHAAESKDANAPNGHLPFPVEPKKP